MTNMVLNPKVGNLVLSYYYVKAARAKKMRLKVTKMLLLERLKASSIATIFIGRLVTTVSW